ncbi:hypothetical protein EVAR_13181_1 [Eumeta japonica]|uniref:Uncharacterized protein n=1 Tax=Eumeta variegata TaxID=151549 RepID=A0A4C1TSB4_EUMVA|nr:hypothetical protein EVAR_13181_1 [Eumeta japonica]
MRTRITIQCSSYPLSAKIEIQYLLDFLFGGGAEWRWHRRLTRRVYLGSEVIKNITHRPPDLKKAFIIVGRNSSEVVGVLNTRHDNGTRSPAGGFATYAGAHILVHPDIVPRQLPSSPLRDLDWEIYFPATFIRHSSGCRNVIAPYSGGK